MMGGFGIYGMTWQNNLCKYDWKTSRKTYYLLPKESRFSKASERKRFYETQPFLTHEHNDHSDQSDQNYQKSQNGQIG